LQIIGLQNALELGFQSFYGVTLFETIKRYLKDENKDEKTKKKFESSSTAA
jgi:hypothetical protein